MEAAHYHLPEVLRLLVACFALGLGAFQFVIRWQWAHYLRSTDARAVRAQAISGSVIAVVLALGMFDRLAAPITIGLLLWPVALGVAAWSNILTLIAVRAWWRDARKTSSPIAR